MRSLLMKSLVLSTALFAAQVFANQPHVSDKDIVANIQQKISADSEVSNTNVNISSNKGEVNLSGTVDTDQQASTLVEIAQSTPGVDDVDTPDLKVKDSSQPMTDAYITAKVKGLFLREKLFSEKDIAAMSVDVETKDGVVHLAGTADSKAEIQNAIHLAKSVKGVKKVESHIKLSNEKPSNENE